MSRDYFTLLRASYIRHYFQHIGIQTEARYKSYGNLDGWKHSRKEAIRWARSRTEANLFEIRKLAGVEYRDAGRALGVVS